MWSDEWKERLVEWYMWRSQQKRTEELEARMTFCPQRLEDSDWRMFFHHYTGPAFTLWQVIVAFKEWMT
jgi:hypothetical protein